MAVAVGGDLGRLGLREIHMARAGNVSGPDGLSVGEPGREMESRGGREGGARNEVASPVNSWSQGHKLMVCLYIRDELGGIPPNTTLLQCNKK